jgi:hypothetical protein
MESNKIYYQLKELDLMSTFEELKIRLEDTNTKSVEEEKTDEDKKNIDPKK